MMTKTVPSGCALPTAATSFSTADAKANLWFMLSDAAAGGVASSEWRDPNGNVETSIGGPWQALSTAGTFCFHEALTISGGRGASFPGTWTVKVTWNGALLFTLTFRIDKESAISAPVIESGGVRHGATFEPVISANSWVTIYGSNFTTKTRVWAESDFAGNKLPTELEGVRVTINDKPAYIYFISPGQINVLAPDDEVVGTVPVRVITAGGTSAPANVEKRRFAPGFFLFSQENKNPAAVHLDGAFATSPEMLPGTNSRRPKPGDIILLYGTGFGRTNPPIAASDVVSTAAELENAAAVRFGSTRAEVLWAGVAGSGLVQLNVRVPAGLSGNAALTAEVGGASTPAGAVLPLQSGSTPPPSTGAKGKASLKIYEGYRISDGQVVSSSDDTADLTFYPVTRFYVPTPYLGAAERIKEFETKPDPSAISTAEIDSWKNSVEAPAGGYWYLVRSKAGRYYLFHCTSFDNQGKAQSYWQINFEWEEVTPRPWRGDGC
ncbi:MAG TPA: IPT/TIG domain-containing protein [Bryobacteraceae bacterium]|nr:IPT/TIG domain-containing protein [Bryobacteraceae bacterium]